MAHDKCQPSSREFVGFLIAFNSQYLLHFFSLFQVTVLFVGILVTGVIGNLIVCLVIVRHPSMRTATNYYLFSLAVSDLIFLLLGLPYEISLYWHQYPYNLGLPFCKIRALISEASTYVSVLTIVAFSMERFLAICHPLHLYTMSGLQRPVRIIAGLWVVSLLSAVPFAVFTDIDYIAYPPTFCAMLSNPEGFPLWELSTCLFFAFPMLIMVVLYGRMGMQIRSRTQRTAELGELLRAAPGFAQPKQLPGPVATPRGSLLGVRNGSVNGPSRISQSRKAIIRMLVFPCLNTPSTFNANSSFFVVLVFSCALSSLVCSHPLSSCRRDNVLRLLGALPCTAATVSVRARLATLQHGQHVAVLRGRLAVLRFLHHQPDTVQCDVTPVPGRISGNTLRTTARLWCRFRSRSVQLPGDDDRREYGGRRQRVRHGLRKLPTGKCRLHHASPKQSPSRGAANGLAWLWSNDCGSFLGALEC
ncbi:AGAP003244-PB [Anopheles gambiae str. PEST]|uniref:AGAP003244-PB n=1 Tax=Anopheles gambiae TaxID=7165 RepID=Q5TTG3_ANOGA|nr:AGAP003244-PB [Anopheles gambiae str. PEST]